jgi:Fungal Zn(2)-Cys(6) binuclear cluster domain
VLLYCCANSVFNELELLYGILPTDAVIGSPSSETTVSCSDVSGGGKTPDDCTGHDLPVSPGKNSRTQTKYIRSDSYRACKPCHLGRHTCLYDASKPSESCNRCQSEGHRCGNKLTNEEYKTNSVVARYYARPANSHPMHRGNNPFGSRGCLACSSCRKRKGHCEFDPHRPDLPCEHCVSNNSVCGYKLSKSEYMNLVKDGGKVGVIKLSSVAMELEKTNLDMDPIDLLQILATRVKQMTEQKNGEKGILTWRGEADG